MPIQHVSDTARWVAYYRAMETERPDALFHDPWARALAGKQGEDVVSTLPQGRGTAWAMIVRTAVLDEIIMRVVSEEHADVVLNLAAGLDTRPYRLRLPPGLLWVEADFPDVLDYKSEVLADARPVCRLRREPADLLDIGARRKLLDDVRTAGERVLVVAEGLLVYLDPDDVAGLARDLHDHLPFRWWLIDLASPHLITWMRRSYGKGIAATDVQFRFAPEQGPDFFTPLGWRPIDVRSTWDESFRLHRTMRGAGLFRIVGALFPRSLERARTMSRQVLLEHTD